MKKNLSLEKPLKINNENYLNCPKQESNLKNLKMRKKK